ncbi:MAG TPA: flagellar hook capping FlgD N-terminal domain-containing protein [Rhodanobacter sp.]|nr:flagellar hook capping FlgD N-terminal domain-containing protein [Rhodanobacter sp.]
MTTNAIGPVPAAAPAPASASASVGAALGNSMNQADFLKLLTTQLQTQDPTKPMDNTQFVSQLAQFSQLASTQDLNASVNNLSGQITSSLQSSQVLGSVGLVGRRVLVPAGTLSYAGSAMSGAVGIGTAVANARVAITNGAGKVVRTLDLGPQQAGLANFSWDGMDANGNPLPPGQYGVSAADPQGNPLTTYVSGNVTGVGYGGASVGTYVQVNGVGGVPLTTIAQIN